MAMSMRERIARAICRTHAMMLLHGDVDAVECQVESGWDSWLAEADAVLAELETPTDGMVNAALVARYPDWGNGKYADSDDARVIDGMRLALSASARAAREGK